MRGRPERRAAVTGIQRITGERSHQVHQHVMAFMDLDEVVAAATDAVDMY
jgi:hypothetical protein